MSTDRGPAAGEAPGDGAAVADIEASPIGDLGRWRWLWEGDHRFPARSHRRFLGPLIVLFKRLLRPFVEAPQADLWERQRAFNLALLAELERQRVDELWQVTRFGEERTARLEQASVERDGREREAGARFVQHEAKFEDLDATLRGQDNRVGHLEKVHAQGLRDVMRHNDALYALVDQKLDRYRREARELLALLTAAVGGGAADGATEPGGALPEGATTPSGPSLPRALEEAEYVELERRYRGTEKEVAERIAHHLPRLSGRRDVLDLGCGRGEALAVLAAAGHRARGVDASAEMVAACRARGLAAEEGDLLAMLAASPPASLDAIVSFHVVEHLPPAVVTALVRLAWRALRPDGVLLLETPNPLSLTVAASRFWIDPTHRRPVHPETLRLACELAGFAATEVEMLRPYPPAERLPELDLTSLPAEQHALADAVNRLRDQLDESLFGFQDYALVARKSG